jgi:hypothetical protein
VQRPWYSTRASGSACGRQEERKWHARQKWIWGLGFRFGLELRVWVLASERLLKETSPGADQCGRGLASMEGSEVFGVVMRSTNGQSSKSPKTLH